jgi:cyclohexyl-isocyanide hydratase
MDRRELIASTLGLTSTLLAAKAASAATPASKAAAPEDHARGHLMAPKSPLIQSMHARAMAKPKPVIALLAYPGMFALDLVAPLSVFGSMGTHQVVVVGKTKDIISAGIDIRPHATFADVPTALDVLFVPGGATGTLAVMEDAETLEFLKSRAAGSKYVTSVCTGSLILAAAGLLKGKKATSHWLARDHLRALGAIPTEARVVIDGNIVTGAGVTAGSDFALTLASILTSKDWAKMVQLVIEYDPDPPFDAGSPKKAGRVVTDAVREIYEPFTMQMADVLPRARKRLGLA